MEYVANSVVLPSLREIRASADSKRHAEPIKCMRW